MSSADQREKNFLTPAAYDAFRRAYSGAYPEEYRRIAEHYRKTKVKADNILDTIHASKNILQGAEELALLVVGVKMLEQTKGASYTYTIIANIALHNEIEASANILADIETVKEFLDALKRNSPR